MKSKKLPCVHLNEKEEIPQIGLGLWKVTDETEFMGAFEAAVAAGYRHFDSAQIYGNEQLLGAAWKKSGLGRDELFLTTKIHIANFGARKRRKVSRCHLRSCKLAT